MIGKNVSHYRVIEKMGQGGMGTVYKAQDTKLDRSVALKFLPPHLNQTEDEKKRFIHEAKAASALQHNNICTIHEINETEDGQMYIVMDCYEGESLKDKIDRDPLPMEEALDIAIQIARGLEKAHAKGIVHRDIKPANVLITQDNQVKIVDFGLAKLAGRTMLTKEGTTLGTVSYMSPEQTEGADVDHRADVWALGIMLYEMLTGERPFKGDYEQAVIYSILNENPVSVTKINPAVPEQLEKIVLKALAKKPAERYASIQEFLKDLSTLTGDQTASASSITRKSIFSEKRNYVYAGFVLILLVIGLNIGGLRDFIVGGGSSGDNIRLAVLPFANLTGDPEQEYLCDGFTQEMISQLGRLHPENLSVIARSSVMRYKEGDTPIDQIGRELDVDYVLEGSTRRDQDEIRISADLIKVSDQTRLWGHIFERKFSSILKVQSEVAENVAQALALNLLPSQKAHVASAESVDPEAYEAYLKGQFHLANMTPEDMDMAMQYFELARKEDPDFALAYVGIAMGWMVRNQFGAVLPKDAVPKAEEAALKALELDSTVAEVHYALACLKTWHTWEINDAEKSFEKAIELNPNYPDARAFYSHYLLIMHRPDEAVQQIERALELDPFNPMLQSLYGVDLMLMRRYDAAIEQFKKVLKTAPYQGLALSNLPTAFHQKGLYEKSMQSLMDYYKAIEFQPGIEALSRGYEQAGYTGAITSAAELWESLSQSTYIIPWICIELYAYAGNKEKTLDWLEKGFETGDPNIPYMGVFPQIIDLVGDEQRYQELLRKMNLPVGDIK